MAVSTTIYYAVHDHQLYEVYFFDSIVTTTVTCNPYVIADWIVNAMYSMDGIDNPVVGMGVQWYPYPGHSPAATLQLAVGVHCLIIQLVHCYDVPDILREFLLYSPYTFVGIWNRYDASRLEECEHYLEFGEPPLDLRHYVETEDGHRLHRDSFETIVAECLGWYGVRLERAISMSNWEEPLLSVDQVQQATVDAYASFLIGMSYHAWEFSY